MANSDDVCDRWLRRNTTDPDARTIKSSNVFFEGNKIYSYGHHFELGRVLKDKRGDVRVVLLNGDTFSVTTNRHQSVLRNAVARRRLPSVIVPYSTLEAAGIDRDSVEVVHAKDEWWQDIEHVSYEQPPGSEWRTDDVSAYVDLTDAELQVKADKITAERREQWELHQRWAVEQGPESYWAKHPKPEPAAATTADVSGYYRREYRKVGERRVLYRSKVSRHLTIDVEELADGRTRYSYTTRRHWLGEALIRGTIGWDTQVRCRVCKATGLKPGRTRAAGAGIPWEDRCETCSGRGRVSRQRKRTALFLSGFDHNEPRPSYFFCEMPPTDAATVEQAYAALKPDAVRLAEQMGRTVSRQGDIFAVALSDKVTRRSLRKAGATFVKRGNLLDTNHEATEVARMPDGTTIVRGVLYHNPGWRGPDHVRCRLGEGWHAVVKNTVPLAA